MMNFVLDDAEFCTKSLDEIAQFLKDRENTAIWHTDDCGLADIRFSPIDSEPLLAAGKLASLRSAPAMKFSASDEAYSDSIFAPSCGYFGSSQLLRVKGNLYPVGDSAIRGITRKLGLYDVHWNRMREFSPAKLSENLNNALDAFGNNGSKCTILVEDEKVRAFNGPNYAICPMTDVMDMMQAWIRRQCPDAKFVIAYANHNIVKWTVDLSAYTKQILKGFPELIANNFTPAFSMRLSHTGDSSVAIIPSLVAGNVYFPISKGLNVEHTKRGGSAAERSDAMKEAVQKSFDGIFPDIEKAAQEIENLHKITVENSHTAVLRGMKSLGMPKAQCIEAAELFASIFPEKATAYDCYMAVVDAYTFVTRDFPDDYRRQFAAADAVGRAIVVIDWEKLGKDVSPFNW